MSGQQGKPGGRDGQDGDGQDPSGQDPSGQNAGGQDAVVRRRRLSWVWLIPLASLLIGGGLLWTTLARRGPLVRVTFDTAESLQAGQSQVKFKDMQMGTVQGFELTPDRKRVVTSIRMTKQAEELLTEGTQFWVVKPRVYAGDITGLNTILTGTYVAMQPGDAGQPAQREFTGLANPPTLVPDTPGRTFNLTASRLGPINLGTPVFFHDLDVGRVVGWDFAGMADSVTLHVFVSAPYAGWVHRDSRFWNSSGIELRVGPQGVRLQVDSLKAVVLGGITFDTPSPGGKAHGNGAGPDAAGPDAAGPNGAGPNGAGPGGAEASAEGDSFPLYATQEAADTATAPRRAELASYFTGSVGGLAVGARVTLQGMAIGDVTSVDLQYSTDTDQSRVRVGFALQLDRVAPVGDKPRQPFREYLPTLVREGLRARLRGGNLITGQKEVALEFMPGAPPAEVAQEGDVQVVPADNQGGGGLDDLTSTATQLMAKLGAVPFADIGRNLNDVLHGAGEVANSPQLRQSLTRLNGTLAAVQDTVRHLDAGAAPVLRRLPAIAADLQDTLAQVRTLTASVSAGSSGDGKFGRDLDRMLQQVSDAAVSLRMVADLLARHPEALIRGRAVRAAE